MISGDSSRGASGCNLEDCYIQKHPALDWSVLLRRLENSVSIKRQSALPLISSERQNTATDGLKASCNNPGGKRF